MSNLNILLTAKIDAIEYDEGKTVFAEVPPHRYDDPDNQMTYKNFFWSFLREIRGEDVLFEGTTPKVTT